MAGPAVTVCIMTCALMLTVCPPGLSRAGENPADAPDGRIIRKVEQDTDQDGRIDQIAHLDGSANPVLLEIDTSGDGHMDTRQYYANGDLIRIEKEIADTSPMVVVDFFENGRRMRHEKQHPDGRIAEVILFDAEGTSLVRRSDTTGDGRFDTVQRFDDPQWSLVIEVHDDNGALQERRAYSDAVLRAREVFDVDTGRPTLVEKYDEKGRITLAREASKNGGPLDMTWHYDENEVAVTAERDTSGDGRVDTWYYYVNGRIDRVAEDRNGDGRPDLWETYDASGAIISSSEDLNLDGTPDMEKTY